MLLLGSDKCQIELHFPGTVKISKLSKRSEGIVNNFGLDLVSEFILKCFRLLDLMFETHWLLTYHSITVISNQWTVFGFANKALHLNRNFVLKMINSLKDIAHDFSIER